MPGISRRAVLQMPLAVASGAGPRPAQPAPAIGLGFGTYGMKSLSTAEALRTLAETGYDAVEMALIPGWPTEPQRLSAGDRRDIRKMLADWKLALPALQESLPLSGTPQNRAANLERLKQATALANDLAHEKPPVVETIIGQRTADWDNVKGWMAEEMAAWAKVAKSAGVTVCFKPHAGQAVNTPERALWLLRQAASDRLRIVFDYSHFSLAGLPLADTLKQLLPFTALISVKDSAGTADKPQYLLPGDGKTDYVEYFTLLKQFGYAGFVVVEVSSMIHSKPGYQPVPTARLCYERLAGAFAKAGLRRLSRG